MSAARAESMNSRPSRRARMKTVVRKALRVTIWPTCGNGFSSECPFISPSSFSLSGAIDESPPETDCTQKIGRMILMVFVPGGPACSFENLSSCSLNQASCGAAAFSSCWLRGTDEPPCPTSCPLMMSHLVSTGITVTFGAQWRR